MLKILMIITMLAVPITCEAYTVEIEVFQSPIASETEITTVVIDELESAKIILIEGSKVIIVFHVVREEGSSYMYSFILFHEECFLQNSCIFKARGKYRYAFGRFTNPESWKIKLKHTASEFAKQITNTP